MSELSKYLLGDNEKLQLFVGEFVQELLTQNPWYFNLAYQEPPKVQLPVAQIGQTHRNPSFFNVPICWKGKTSIMRR
jgi:hypothetical protein